MKKVNYNVILVSIVAVVYLSLLSILLILPKKKDTISEKQRIETTARDTTNISKKKKDDLLEGSMIFENHIMNEINNN